MKILISLFLLGAIAQSAMAANGSLLTGISPNSTAQGGTGVSGTGNTLDAMYKNPALLGSQKYGPSKVTVELMGNLYKQGPNANAGPGAFDTNTGVKPLPSLALAYQINPTWAIGLGAFTYGGGVADYSNQAAAAQLGGIQTEHGLIKFQPTVSYNVNEWLKVGVGPFLNYNTLVTNEAFTGTQTTRKADGQFGAGVIAGIAVKPAKGLDLGVTYTSKSGMTFSNMINLSLLGLPTTANAAAGLNSIRLEQPTELALGLGYELTSNWRLAVDGRYIAWAGARGYSDLGWNDQYVVALGTEYKMDKLALRAGFNYGASPIASMSGSTGTVPFESYDIQRSSLDRLNLIAFPGMAESHLSLGAGYAVTEAFDLDLSVMYAPAVTKTRSGTFVAFTPPSTVTPGVAYNYSTTVVQWSVALGGAYRF